MGGGDGTPHGVLDNTHTGGGHKITTLIASCHHFVTIINDVHCLNYETVGAFNATAAQGEAKCTGG